MKHNRPQVIQAQPCSSAYLVTSDENLIIQDIEIVQIIAWRVKNEVAIPILACEVEASCQDVFPIDKITGKVIHPIHGAYDCICDVIDHLFMGIDEDCEVPA